MSRPPSNFRQTDVERAMKAAKSAGYELVRVEIDPKTTKIVLVVKEDGKPEKKINPFDDAPTPWSGRKPKAKAS